MRLHVWLFVGGDMIVAREGEDALLYCYDIVYFKALGGVMGVPGVVRGSVNVQASWQHVPVALGIDRLTIDGIEEKANAICRFFVSDPESMIYKKYEAAINKKEMEVRA